MCKINSFCQLIVIGILAGSTVVTSTPVVTPKSDFHMMLENNWPDPDPNINRFPHQTSCHYYYLVLSEEDISIRKCHHDKLFDYTVHKCVEKESANCWSRHFSGINHDHRLLHKTPKKFKCPYAYGKFPDVTDCTRYFQCLSGTAKSKKCAPFEYFDKIERKCIAEIDAVCADETDVVEHTFKCPRTYGSFAFSKDCSKYYECIEKRPDLLTCPRHALFDEKKRGCTSHRHVQCGSRHNPYEETTSILSAPTTLSSQKKDKVEDLQENISDVSQYLSSSYTPPHTTSNDEISDVTNTDYDSSISYNVKEFKKSSEDPDKGDSKESDESSEDIDKDNSKESKETSENPHKDNSKESKETSENPHNDNSKESKETSENPHNDNSKESLEDLYKNNSNESKKSLEDLRKDNLKESKEFFEDNKQRNSTELNDVSYNETAIVSELDDSTTMKQFISTVEIKSIDKISSNQEIVPTSNEQSSTYPSTEHDTVCLRNDHTCISVKNRIFRCPDPNGLFPYPEDERRFLHCGNSQIYVKWCPEKLIFKDSLKACAFPLSWAQKNA